MAHSCYPTSSINVNNKFTFKILQYVIAINVQGYYYNLRLRSRGSWILVGIWCLMCVVLANAYAGVLFSFLSVAKLEPIVKSLEELANAKQLKLIVQDRSELANRYLVHIYQLLNCESINI